MLRLSALGLCVAILAGCGGSSSPSVTHTGNTSTVPDNGGTQTTDPFDNLRAVAQDQLAASNAPAVSIAIMKDSELVFAEAFGKKRFGGEEAVNTDTLFQLGSTTKMFTALATLQLVDENVLTLDEPLYQALPPIDKPTDSNAWRDITLHHLMTHQSGFIEAFEDDMNNSLMDLALYGFPYWRAQMNPAGKFFNYSNTGWSYLGAVVEHHRGMPYEQAMEQYVFEPLGMTRATMRYEQVLADGNYALGVGHTIVNDELVAVNSDSLEQILDVPFARPAGVYTWASASELVKMGDFLLNGDHELLSAPLREQMTQNQVGLQQGLPQSYGYGVFVSGGVNRGNQWYSMPVWEHGGNTLAYTNMLWMLPEQNIVVAIMTSGEQTDFSNTMFAALEAVTQLPELEAIPFAPEDVAALDNHIGDYQYFDLKVSVSRQDDELRLTIHESEDNAQIETVLRPIAATFYVAVVDGERYGLTFLPDEPGGQSMYIRNRGFVFTRTDASNALAKPQGLKQNAKPFSVPTQFLH